MRRVCEKQHVKMMVKVVNRRRKDDLWIQAPRRNTRSRRFYVFSSARDQSFASERKHTSQAALENWFNQHPGEDDQPIRSKRKKKNRDRNKVHTCRRPLRDILL